MDSTGSDMDHRDHDYDEARQDLDLRHQHRFQHFHPDLTFDHDPSSRSGYAHDDNFASTDTHDHHASSAIDPDDRYFNDQMASSSVPRPSLRSNGDGTTPRHPVVSPNRSLPRPNNARSASNPVAATTTAKVRPNPNGKPSVKDLKKRFDQSGNGSSIPRTPGTRTDNASGPRVQTTWKGGEGANSYASVRSGGSEPNSSDSKARSQRPKYLAEDHISSNAQSFASRVAKPRASGNGANSNASPAMVQRSPQTPSHPTQPPPALTPTTLPPQGLLFGEILPDQYDTSALGFGIESIRPRRGSGPDTRGSWSHQRSLSDPYVELPSADAWYEQISPVEGIRHHEASQPPAPKSHGRSLSDVASQKAPQLPSRKGATRIPTSTSQTQNTTSRLPLSVRQLSTPGDSSSADSTRSNSPATSRRPYANGRASRATTPTARSKAPTSRAKTPTQPAGSGRRRAPPGLPTPNSNTRLQAYIAAPPPKLSPPLRSSRPRQPVSMATTASSRSKAIDRPPRTTVATSRASSRAAQEPESRRRKVSIGPIDFEQRREHIRLAYSKSVRESQALESRKRAADRRRRELEAATQAQAATQSSSAAPSPLARETSTAEPESPSDDTPVEHRPHVQAALDAVILTESPVDVDFARPETMAAPSEETIQPEESSAAPHRYPVLETPPMDVPGSFPAFSPQTDRDEPPLSAVSATTETTEFDVEPQDEPSRPATPQSDTVPFTIKPPSPQQLAPVRSRSEYYSPFEDDLHSPSVDSDSHEPVQVSRVSTVSAGYDDENSMSPVAAYEERFRMDREQPPPMASSFSTTVTILPPQHAADSETIPFPRLDMQDDSDCHTDLDDTADPARNSAYGYDNATDTCTEDADDHLPLDDCQSESQCDDHRSSQILSSCATSDAGDVGYEPNVTEPTTLLVPPSWSNRISQHSQWTDLTVDSPYPSSFDQSPNLDDPEESPTYGHVTIFGSQVIGRGSDPGTRGSEHDSPHAQQSHTSIEPQRSSTQQLPNVDVGDDFTIPYLSENPARSAPNIGLPEHEPPPVPTPASGSLLMSSRSSGYDDQSQYGSTRLASGHGSEEFMSQLETPRTIDTNSVGTPDQYFGAPSYDSAATKVVVANGDELPEKERHRLVQRRNVIKELVDTEAVFVRDMNIVEEIYKGTAEACPKLDDKTVKQIFRNTDEIISFHTHFLAQVKDAAANVYVMKSGRSSSSRDDGNESSSKAETSDAQDRTVLLGPLFKNNIEQMKTAHEGFLRSSDQAAKRLIQIQQDPTVKVWLNECNEVAKDLTAAWDLDSLLIKPMQRITKYPNLIITILQHTPQDHPDRKELVAAKDIIENAIIEINKTKKNFELVGQIVGRKRKESDGKSGFARAFGKRVDKLQAPGARIPEDPEYAKLHEKFGDDYLRLQVVLRDVEFYTRQISTYVREFLQYLSSVELVMRIQPGGHPELESKWVQFNISIRDIEKIALEEHLAQVRKQVIEPFELVIKAYGNPSLAMKKRQKRRLDYERNEQLKRAGKSPDSKLKDLVEEYEALNDTLKKELPALSRSTVEIGNLCLVRFVDIQTKWFRIWKEKMKAVLKDNEDMPDLDGIVNTFQREFPYVEEQLASIGILNPTTWSRPSMSTFASTDDALSRKTRSPRPSDVDTMRSRGLSTTTDSAPSLPTPDFMKRESSTSSISPVAPKNVASPYQYNYRDYYAGFPPATAGSSAAVTPEVSGSSRSVLGGTSTRPSTGRSFDSGAIPRQSMESQSQYRRDSSATYNSSTMPQEGRRFSGLFHSALPLPDGPEENKPSSSRASSMDRGTAHDGYNVLWLAASLFEFNIATTKHEAGYPYLIYQAGEIFDVIAEKGELWLAKNQDDASEQVGWIWSKHFAKLADS